MIHADTETQRITTIRATVTIDVCGLHAYQEEQVAELCTRAAHHAVVDALRQEHEASSGRSGPGTCPATTRPRRSGHERDTPEAVTACSWAGCERPQVAHGLCQLHRMRSLRGGAMDAPVRRVSRTPAGVTCEDVAQVLGVTGPQRVQQIEQRALAKCRAWCRERGLTLADLVLDDAPGWVWPEAQEWE